MQTGTSSSSLSATTGLDRRSESEDRACRMFGDQSTIGAVNQKVGGFQYGLTDEYFVAHDIGAFEGLPAQNLISYGLQMPTLTRVPSASLPIA